MHALTTKTVLYVEDNPVNRVLVEAIFESRPRTRLVTVSCGGVGLEFAKQHRPDLILLDLNLPDMDGEEYLAELRGDPSTADLCVVIVSADAVNNRREHCLRLGVADYITKPFDLLHFEQMVDRCLGMAE
jgi:CheY-like chemotaxis protein